jgi:hypothetical protein
MTRIFVHLVLFAVSIGCSGSNNARAMSAFHEIGRFRAPNMHALFPGITHFVVAPESAMSNRRAMLAYSRRACAAGDEQICFVLFWPNESNAARGFPLTSGQADAMVASYTRNRSTGYDDFQCYNFGPPAERCAKR